MFLELRIVPVKFILKGKWANFLKYILNESKTSTIRQVYEALKDDTRKGDFVSLVKRQVRTAAYSYLKNKNSDKDKTKKY